MTTYASPGYTYMGTITARTNAEFQEFCQRCVASITAAGLVQTADTGQTDLATITVGSAGSDRGSSMFRFDDAAQATYPIYVKLNWRMGSGSASRFAIGVSIGTGTNGANTLTGTFTGQSITGGQDQVEAFNYTAQDFVCHTEGFFGCALGALRAVGNPVRHAFFIERTKTAAGASDGVGAILWTTSATVGGFVGGGEMSGIRWASPTMVVQNTLQACMAVGRQTSPALLNGDKLLYPFFYNTPEVRQTWGSFIVAKDDFAPAAVTFTATPHVNGAARTFLTFGLHSSNAESSGSTAYGVAFLWE